MIFFDFFARKKATITVIHKRGIITAMMTISCVSYGRISSYEAMITLISFGVVVVEIIDVVVIVGIVSVVVLDVFDGISVTSVEIGVVVVVSVFVDD